MLKGGTKKRQRAKVQPTANDKGKKTNLEGNEKGHLDDDVAEAKETLKTLKACQTEGRVKGKEEEANDKVAQKDDNKTVKLNADERLLGVQLPESHFANMVGAVSKNEDEKCVQRHNPKDVLKKSKGSVKAENLDNL